MEIRRPRTSASNAPVHMLVVFIKCFELFSLFCSLFSWSRYSAHLAIYLFKCAFQNFCIFQAAQALWPQNQFIEGKIYSHTHTSKKGVDVAIPCFSFFYINFSPSISSMWMLLGRSDEQGTNAATQTKRYQLFTSLIWTIVVLLLCLLLCICFFCVFVYICLGCFVSTVKR